MAAYNKFNCFTGDLANGKHNLASDALKIMLTNTLPVATNAVFTDVSAGDLATANGYTAGGVTLATQSDTDTAGVTKLLESADNTITASGAIGPFRYAIMYNNTSATKPLIAWWDYGSSITMANLETFLIDNDQAAGIFTIT